MTKKPETELGSFFSLYKTVKYRKGEIILKPKTSLDFVGQVKSGMVRIYTVNSVGREVTVPLFGSVFELTAASALIGTINKFYFEAMTPVEMWLAPKKDFVDFWRQNNEVASQVLETISKMFLDMAENNSQLLGCDSIGKVAVIIDLVNRKKVDIQLTHKLIGSLTGLTRETVTLQMLKLEDLKLIDNENRQVTILDQKGLNKIMEK